MSYDLDEESANFNSESRNSERFSTVSTMIANYEHKLANICEIISINNLANELKIVSQKVSQKLK